MKQFDYTLSENYFKQYYLDNYYESELISKWKHQLIKFDIEEQHWKKVSLYLERMFNDNIVQNNYGEYAEIIFNITMTVFNKINLNYINFINNTNTEVVQISYQIPYRSLTMNHNIDDKKILYDTIILELIKILNKYIEETGSVNFYSLIENIYLDNNNSMFSHQTIRLYGKFEQVNSRLAKIKKIKKKIDEGI